MNSVLRDTFRRGILAGTILTIVSGGLVAAPTISAAQAANPYPAGKSTFWAWQNRPDLPSNLGEARDWARNASAQGWPVSAYPRPYSIAVYPPGVLGADPLIGHVAVVKQVNDDGSYVTTQMDESDCAGSSANCGRVNMRTVMPTQGVQFIHYLKDSRTTWGFAGGAAGWTPVNMDGGSGQQSGWRYKLLGGDPQLVSPQLDVPLDGYDAVEVDMTLNPGVSDSSLRLDFATGNQTQFLKGEAVQGIADGALHTYHFRLAAEPAWRGSLTALRLHPAGSGSVGSVRVDRVRLVHEESAPEGQAMLRDITSPAVCPCGGGRTLSY